MRIACYPDLHYPFHDQKKVEEAHRIVKAFRPDAIFQLGDLEDQFGFSKYAKNPSCIPYTPKQEAEEAHRLSVDFWRAVRRLNPKAKLYQITDANHDVRIVKRIMEKAPEASFIAEDWLSRRFEFDGVNKVQSEFVLDGIMFMHGFRKGGDHAKYNQMNTVTGHTHKAKIEYFGNIHGPYWEMNCGYLGLTSSPVFSYREQKKIQDCHTGVGLIENQQPRFVVI